MSLVPFTINAVKLQVVSINGKEWCRAKEVCKALEYEKKTAHMIRAHCSTEKFTQKYQLSGVPALGTPISWPSDFQKYDLYINKEGLYKLLFSSQQPLAKSFRKHCCNVMFPHIRQQMIGRVMEEKEAVLALSNDELTDQDNQIQAIQYKNVELQGKVRAKDHQIERCENRIQDLIANRHVPRSGDIDTVLVVEKNEEHGKAERHLYYMVRCQKRRLKSRLDFLRVKYPDMEAK